MIMLNDWGWGWVGEAEKKGDRQKDIDYRNETHVINIDQ